jgi:outer membrane protein OmpA-like peptidoglycan-associated protein
MLRLCSRALVPLLLAAGAHAQTLDDAAGQGAGSLDLERFRPGLDGSAILDVESADVGEANEVDAAAHLGYANAPMTGAIVENGERSAFRVVDHRTGGNITGALSLLPLFKLGFDLPVVLWQAGPTSIPGLAGDNPVALFGVGDLRVVGKYGLLRVDDGAPVNVAVVGHLTLPTSLPRHQYIGDGLPTLAAEVALSRDDGALRWAFNAGPKLRVPSTFGPAVQGQELGYRVGVAWDGEGLPVGLDASFNGAALLSPSPLSAGNNPAEVLVGLHRYLGDAQVYGGVGAGVPTLQGAPLGGIGAPLFRLQAGVRYMPRCHDDDGDGFCRADDKCPDQAEDKDGFADGDGCLDADNDADGVLDASDKCSSKAEDKDGFADDDGCPDADNDSDGIADGDDTCAHQAEDNDGFADADGCPDADNDNDGITDGDDQCPNEAEDKDGFSDVDGCLDADNDDDGIADSADKCSNEAEDKDGDADDDGCPDVVPPPSLSLNGSASFKTASAKLRGSAKTELRKFVDELKAAGKPYRIRIEGHTDDDGTETTNNRLSQARADAVKAYLIQLGIPAAQVEAKGFGESKPLVPNDSDEHRAQNRRVDVVVDG